MKNIMKIVTFPKDSASLIKGINQTIKNETKEQKGGVPGMVLGTLISVYYSIC